VSQSEANGIGFKALHYLVGECNYGGRVTDERDRRTVRALLYEYVSEAVLYDTFKFGGLKDFVVPQALTHEEFLKHI
jgi:dynein heavy chain, axonemal